MSKAGDRLIGAAKEMRARIPDIETYIDRLEAENARLREALEKIASETAATWVSDVARAALAGKAADG